jgi:DASS family divalent anion:Na+ symporter
MFLTSMAGNPLIAKFASEIAHVEITWLHWAAASFVPGVLTLLFLPWFLHYLQPPQRSDTSHAQAFARARLAEMGPASRSEKLLFLTLLLVIAGWITSPWHGTSNTVVALTGVCALLLTRVLDWDDILGNRRAWEVLIWFATLLMMADQLSRQGVMQIVFEPMFAAVHGWPWAFTLAAVVIVYFYAHYGFASLTAQISALFPIFLAAAISLGSPAPLAVWALAFCSNLNAGLTHFGTGSAPVYFTEGYVPQRTWWLVGLILSGVNLALWIGIGSMWWSLIGLW